MAATERQIQQTVFDYAYGLAGNLEPRLRLLYVIANGAWKGKGSLEAGVRESAGIPDICLPVPVEPFCGLYIELKVVKGGKISSKQRDWQRALRQQGYASEVCRGADTAIEVLHQYLDQRLAPF